MQETTLADMRPGQKGKVLKIAVAGPTRKRIAEMGMLPGAVTEVIRVAPLGDPIDVKVRGYHLSLRKTEAVGVLVHLFE
jgi:Fe2+ transport system protein FeoA